MRKDKYNKSVQDTDNEVHNTKGGKRMFREQMNQCCKE